MCILVAGGQGDYDHGRVNISSVEYYDITYWTPADEDLQSEMDLLWSHDG